MAGKVFIASSFLKDIKRSLGYIVFLVGIFFFFQYIDCIIPLSSGLPMCAEKSVGSLRGSPLVSDKIFFLLLLYNSFSDF